MKNTAQKITTLLVIALFSLNPTATKAQSTLGLTAIPPRLEITGKPGETVSETIKVRNESAVEKVINIKTTDFIVIDNSGTPVQVEGLDETTNRWAAASWLQVSQTKLKLKPGETKSLTLTAIIPDNALPGGHYAMVLHSPQNTTVLSETGSLIETNVGTLVYVVVPGDIKESAFIKDFSAPNFSEYGPINFKAQITNLSDVHITPVANILISDIFGFKTASLPLGKLNIFPYASRSYQQSLTTKLLIGRFKAMLTASYGTNGQVANSTIFFWVMPWRLLITLIAIVFITALIVKLKKQSPKSENKKEEKIEMLEEELETLKKKYRDR
jgi:hypothetical protein